MLLAAVTECKSQLEEKTSLFYFQGVSDILTSNNLTEFWLRGLRGASFPSQIGKQQLVATGVRRKFGRGT